jgi:hypothetical protein
VGWQSRVRDSAYAWASWGTAVLCPHMNLPSFKVASAVLLFAAGGFGEFAGGFYDLFGQIVADAGFVAGNR